MRSTRTAVLTLLFALLLLAPSTYAALCGEEQDPCNPNKMGSKCYKPKTPCQKCKPKKCNKCTKSPGYVGLGAYEIDAADLSIPSAAGFPLLATRRYDSTHQFDGALGYGWISSFEPRLFHAAYLFAAPNVYRHEVDVVLPDTEHFTFTDPNGTGVFTPEAGRHDKLVKNVDGSWDLTLQHSRSVLHYDAQGLLTSAKDDFGNEQVWTYDVAGRLQRVADNAGSGRYLDIIWGADGRISHIQDHTARQIAFTYDTRGVLTEVANPLVQKTYYSYVPGRFAPLLSQIRDHWNRVITDVTWDAQDRVTSYTEEGEQYTYTYGTGSVTSKTDSAGNTWSYPYDSDGLVTEDRLPGGAKRYTTFDADGNVQLATDEVGVKTLYTYDAAGRTATVTRDYLGTAAVRWEYTYHPDFPDRLAAMVPKQPATNTNDPNWKGLRNEYHALGSLAPGALHRVLNVRDDGVTGDVMSTYSYDGRGRVAKVTNAHGGESDYVYDVYGNLVSVTSPLRSGVRPVTSYVHDAAGRVTSVTDPRGGVSSYTYDALDRVLTVTSPKPFAASPLNFTTTYVYDAFDSGSGLVYTYRTDSNGTMTKTARDAIARVRRAVDSIGNTATSTYTGRQLLSLTDPNGNVTSFEYDAMRRLSAAVHPDGGRDTYTYHADGQQKTQTDRKNQTITYSYDGHKRVTRKAYSTGGYIDYSYAGQKISGVYDTTISPPETHALAYDASFRITSNTQANRGTVSYTYTAGGSVATRTAGTTVTYGYYSDGTVDTIAWSAAAGHFKYEYTPDGHYASVIAPNGQLRTYTYDDQGRLVQLASTHPTTGNLATFTYGYDLNHDTGVYTRLGERVSTTADVPAQGLSAAQTKFMYDDAYRLVGADYPLTAPFGGASHAWSYDALGNRVTSRVNNTTTNLTYLKMGSNVNNSPRLSSDGVDAYTYDANGNTLMRGAVTYLWNADNRIVSATVGGASSTYTYDFAGRRTSKTVAGITTTYLYDGLHIVDEFSAQTASYLFGPGIDEALATVRSGTVLYYSPDAQGSVVTANVADGTVSNAYAYDVWGDAVTTAETVPQPLRYTGRELGEAPNDLFYRARFYNASVGRFLSEDPLIGVATRARGTGAAREIPLLPEYQYARNSPGMFTDPLGLDPGGNGGPTGCVQDCIDTQKSDMFKCLNSFMNMNGGCTFGFMVCFAASGGVATLPCLGGLASCQGVAAMNWISCKAVAQHAYGGCLKKCCSP